MSELLRDRYEPIEVVGEGGEGRLVKALDHQHDRFVALKLRAVPADADRDLMLHEARVLLSLPPHPNLAIVRDDFFENGQYAIVMDWVDGIDLSRVLQARGRPGLAPSSVLPWLAEAAAALTYLHTQDPPVIHGDVKPANLVLTRGGHIVLVDFGVSSVPGTRARRLGTPGFTAPELLTEPPSRASDVYALAATAFTLLTGAPPTGIPASWEGIEPDQAAVLETAIRAGLATNPARRPGTPGEFVERVRAGWGSTLPTGALTFCLSDIEGSTRAWEHDPAAMARALVRHDEIIGETVEANGGRFLKSMGEGDATVSVFPSAAQAVVATIECQQRLAAEPWPGDLGLRVRMALHTGEAEQRDGDYFGPTLNVGARLRALADGKQVFVSGATAALVEHALPAGAALVELGPHRLTGVSEPIAVYAIDAAGIDAPPPGTECPYQGLLPYDVDDRARFFGRSAVVDELAEQLHTAGFVALFGSSGSGKSSVLRAGLVPTFGNARVMTPGQRAEPVADGTELLVIDQFEELFTLGHDDEARRRFIDSVLAHSGPVVLGIRADFYGSCASHPGLAAAVASHQLLLGPMNDAELRDAIVEPAATCGLRVEPALVDVLVTEVASEPGALPLLSHAMLATWAARDGRTLTVDVYRSTGGVRAAIATTADRVLDSFDAQQHALARQILLRLVEPNDDVEDARRRAALTEFAGPDARAANEILDRLAAARLVTVDEGSVQLAHEALIREWPQLQQWLDEDRAALRVHRHLTTASAAWLGAGRDPSELYRGQRLALALEWRASGPGLSTTEAEFLDASVADRDRALHEQISTNRRLRVLLGAVVVVLVIALVAGGVAFVQRRRASDARDRADVSRVAAVSRSVIERQADLGVLLAAAAYELEPTPDTRSTLLAALTAHPLLLGVLRGERSGLDAAAFSPDGAVLATPTTEGTILWDTRNRQRLATLRTEHGDVLLGAAFSPDGRLLAVPVAIGSGEDDPGIQIWQVASGRPVRFLPSPSGSLSSVTWSADGATLIAQGGPAIDLPSPPTTAVVWDTTTWTPHAPWTLADTYVGDRRLAVSRDGHRIALPLPDGSVQVWDARSRAPIGTALDPSALLGREAGDVTALALSDDGAHLAIGTEAGAVLVVEPQSRAVSSVLNLSADAATSIEFSPDGARVAVGRSDGRTELFDRVTATTLGAPLAANASAINDVTFSSDGSLLATAGFDRTGAIWSLDGRRTIGVPLSGQDGLIAEVAFTPSGRLLTAAADGSVAVRDGETGRIRRRLDLGGEALTVAADPTGRRVAAAGTGGEVRIWDSESGAPRAAIPVGDAWVFSVAYRPDGRVLAIAVDNSQGDLELAGGPGVGLVRFVDPATGRELGTPIAFDNGQPLSLAWSPDGRRLAVATADNFAHVFDARTRRAVAPEIEGIDALITDVAFSPDGTRVLGATASGVTRAWDARTGREVPPELVGPSAPLTGVAYDAVGNRVAATTFGLSTTYLWEMPEGRALGGELVGGRIPYTNRTVDLPHFARSRPAFSPDGTRLATPGADGAAVLWDVRPDAWLRAACAVAGRDLTAAEWREHLPGRDPFTVCPGPR